MSCRRLLPAACMLAMAALATASAADRGQFIVSVDVAELVRRTVGEGLVASVRSGSPTGVSYRLLAGEKGVGYLIVGVFADKDEARAGLERRLAKLGQEPVLRSDIEFGDVGAVWGDMGAAQPDRYVAFSRDNAVVSVGLRDGRVREVAKAIDQALITGTNGVQRSERIHLPRIVSIDIPDHLPPGKMVPVRVRVAVPERACRDRLTFSDRSRGRIPILDIQGEVEVTRIAHYHVPRTGKQARKRTFWVSYATAGCVVVSKKVAIPAIVEPPVDAARTGSAGELRPLDVGDAGVSDERGSRTPTGIMTGTGNEASQP